MISYLPEVHNVSIPALFVLIGVTDDVRITTEKLPMQIFIGDFHHAKILYPVYFYKVLNTMQNKPTDIDFLYFCVPIFHKFYINI